MPQSFADTPAAEMKTYPVIELSGHALDCAVEVALGHQVVCRRHYLLAAGVTLEEVLLNKGAVLDPSRAQYTALHRMRLVTPHSSSWSLGGTFIDAEKVMFYSAGQDGVVAYFARSGKSGLTAPGPDHLVAAARLRALAVLGSQVSLPVALVEEQKATA